MRNKNFIYKIEYVNWKGSDSSDNKGKKELNYDDTLVLGVSPLPPPGAREEDLKEERPWERGCRLVDRTRSP